MNATSLFFTCALGRLRLVFIAVCIHPTVWAQTPWPAMQVDMYPYVETMLQSRPEQTILLGEGERQTGIFYATVAEAHTEEVHSALIADAEEKDWQLLSVVRIGTNYIMTLTKNERILDLRLTHTARGVEVVYTVLMNQQPRRK